MKFYPSTLWLVSETGQYLKKLKCPLYKNWNALVPDPETPLKRYCNSCAKSVIDISDMTESDVVMLLKIDADSCFCIRGDAKNIEIVDESPQKLPGAKFKTCMLEDDARVDGCSIVLTARSFRQISLNKENYTVLIRPVTIDERIKQKVRIEDNERGYSGYDARGYFINDDLTNWWHPLVSTYPFAAYLIPKGLEAGQRVYVPDIIEDFFESRWNQGDTYRFNHGFGIYTGESIQFDYPETPEDSPMWLG